MRIAYPFLDIRPSVISLCGCACDVRIWIPRSSPLSFLVMGDAYRMLIRACSTLNFSKKCEVALNSISYENKNLIIINDTQLFREIYTHTSLRAFLPIPTNVSVTKHTIAHEAHIWVGWYLISSITPSCSLCPSFVWMRWMPKQSSEYEWADIQCHHMVWEYMEYVLACGGDFKLMCAWEMVRRVELMV